ncbi:MAG: hypothetical protein BMS9Abin02_0447 [Anaerolineae bacterium]|nr:MAG: hypothetical protein BMS9Abin02_0447 [Anaerolineae bacterium]
MGSRIEKHRHKFLWLILSFVILSIFGVFLLSPAAAENGGALINNDQLIAISLIQEEEGIGYPPDDMACRLCHADTDQEIVFPSGESNPVIVDFETLDSSAHGGLTGPGLACTECHQAADYQFPHEDLGMADFREYEIERSAVCERCHLQTHLTSHPGDDSETPIVCTDCHGSHEVITSDQWQVGEGTSVCVDCHISLEVGIDDPVQLTQIIRDGLFTPEVDSQYCLSCHRQPGLTFTFENGDEISITIDEEDFLNSVHGDDNPWQPLECTNCHGRDTYPHGPVGAGSEREYTLERYRFCAECHERHYEHTIDSVHGRALEEGNMEAAVCTDCHGAHDTVTPNVPRERISETCRQCHSGIFDEYKNSIHGEALLQDSNPDVPTCIDCHGVHDIDDPTTAQARNRSPELCSGCHADENLMAQYDISTDVFDTYVADFHGTTVTLFEYQDPNLETNKAVCYDCHGVHNIKQPDDPDAGIKVNLLETCRQCHPDASENFPDAWTSHFKPSLEHNPMVFLVDTFYEIFIPLTLGFFAFLIATDIYRRVRVRFRVRIKKND